MAFAGGALYALGKYGYERPKGGSMWADRIRYVAAALAGVTAVIYFLIAAHVLPVVEVMDRGITVFGLVAGGGFVVGVVLLLAVKRRIVWMLGALLMILTVIMYFVVGRDRTPNYEIWGLLLRIPQVLILAGLAYLSLQPVTRAPSAGTPSQPDSAATE